MFQLKFKEIYFCVLFLFICDIHATDWNLSVRIQIRDGKQKRIKKVGLEEYTARVLMKEVPLSWPDEVLRAQSVAIRSYAVYKKFLSVDTTYDLKDSVLDQVYSDAERIPEKLKRITLSTKGQILTWKQQPAPAFYHSSCIGRTIDGHKVFPGLEKGSLPSVKCYQPKNKSKWKLKITDFEFRESCAINLKNIGNENKEHKIKNLFLIDFVNKKIVINIDKIAPLELVSTIM